MQSPIANRTTHHEFLLCLSESNRKNIDGSHRPVSCPINQGKRVYPLRIRLQLQSCVRKTHEKQKKSSQIKAVTAIIRKLKASGLQPTFHILDNEVSTDLIELLETDENITVQLAPARCHCMHAAERAIRLLRNHFIAGLFTIPKKFHLNKWDSLLPQADSTLNLLRTSRLNPKLSAHALLNGPYNFNATPMAPPGSKIFLHKKPALRGTWVAHAVND